MCDSSLNHVFRWVFQIYK